MMWAKQTTEENKMELRCRSKVTYLKGFFGDGILLERRYYIQYNHHIAYLQIKKRENGVYIVSGWSLTAIIIRSML